MSEKKQKEEKHDPPGYRVKSKVVVNSKAADDGAVALDLAYKQAKASLNKAPPRFSKKKSDSSDDDDDDDKTKKKKRKPRDSKKSREAYSNWLLTPLGMEALRLSVKQFKKVLKSGDDLLEQIKSTEAYKDLIEEEDISKESTVAEVAKALAKKMLYQSFLDKIYESTGYHIDEELDDDDDNT